MKLLSTFFILVLLAGSATASSWDQITPGSLPGVSDAKSPANPAGSDRSLMFFNDETAFLEMYPELTWEGFDNTNVPAGSYLLCEGPFNSATDNDCYSPGAIVEGVSLDSGDRGDNAVIGDGFMGNDSVWVGPNWFNDHAYISLDPAVAAFGCLIVFPNADSDVTIEVFGANGSLGGETIFATTTGTFWAVASDGDPITEISFHAPASEAELFDYVYFGDGGLTAASESNWSTIKSLY